ncbi:hypothetical protein [Kutzneria kofuensis]|uniref:Uncharacterized protein n=1 Tax=Kutzneria kofuensis TaxID=103725 RepID=A0A7W9KP90_9PSEU|nr:hypothetical protein [Kutzneria kofuensis]MBB5896201.1 hypothetical protein [Kutzneria kofuensis]
MSEAFYAVTYTVGPLIMALVTIGIGTLVTQIRRVRDRGTKKRSGSERVDRCTETSFYRKGADLMPSMDDLQAESVTLRMPARIWAGIDAGMDNVVSLATVDGDAHAVRVGQAIREAGWAQVPWVDGLWPPMDQIISIRLTRAQWRFAADEARESAIDYESLRDEASAQLCRDALAVIEAADVP